MYPDTDLPPIALSDERVDGIRESLGSRPWERFARLKELGVGDDLSERLSRHRAWYLFEHLQPRLGSGILNATTLASMLLDRSCPRPAAMGAAGIWWEKTVERIQSGEIIPEAVWNSDEDLLDSLSEEEGRKIFNQALKNLPPDGPTDPPKKEIFAMKHVMKELLGRVPGKTVRSWVAEVMS